MTLLAFFSFNAPCALSSTMFLMVFLMKRFGALGLLAASLAHASPATLDAITVLNTQLASTVGRGEWGFASLLSFKDQKPILYDTGFSKDLTITNAGCMKIDLSQVETVVLSHHHSDHTSGLLALREAFVDKNPKAFQTVYVGKGFFEQRFKKDKKTKGFFKTWSIGKKINHSGVHFTNPLDFKKAAEALGMRFIEVDKPIKLFDNLYLTGPVERVYDEKNYPLFNFVENAKGDKIVDAIHDSMALGMVTDKGWVLLTGCGHAGVMNMSRALTQLENKPVYAVVGGLHLFNANAEAVDAAAYSMRDHGIKKLIGAHCTGAYAVSRIAEVAGLTRKDISNGAIGTRLDGDLNIKRAPGFSTE